MMLWNILKNMNINKKNIMKKLKVESFKVHLHSDSTTSGVSNINSSNGARECTTRNFSADLEIFTNSLKNIIYLIEINSTRITNGEFGSYGRDNSYGHFYLANNDKDYDSTLILLKKGILPAGLISGEFFSNYNKNNYNKNNNWPMSLCPYSKSDYIKSRLEKNELAIEVYFYDSFEHNDGLMTCPDEDLYNGIYFSLPDFNKLIKSPKDRVKLLWDKLEIDENYNCEGKCGENILDDSNLREVIIDGFKRLAITETSNNIENRVAAIKDKIVAHKEMMDERIIRSRKSNAKFIAENINEVFLTEEQKTGGITLQEMKNLNGEKSIPNKQIESKENLDRVSFLDELHEITYKKKKNLPYEEYIEYIIKKITNPNDHVDVDYAFRSLDKLFHKIERVHSSVLDINKIEPMSAFELIAKDFGVSESSFYPILDLAIKTPLQLLKSLLNK